MEKATKLQKNKRGIRYWLKVLHRDLGYLAVGLCLVYGISGILLNHLEGNDPAFKKEEKELTIATSLSSQESIKEVWATQKELPKLKKVLRVDEEHFQLLLDGGIGVYNKNNGKVEYETHKKRWFVYWINRLHYNNLKGWTFMADFFAGTLIFLAISGLFILRGKNGLAKRGKWFVIAGLLIPIFYIILCS